jgi:MFS family permease
MYAVVPEALAVAYAAERGLGPASVGLLMAAVAGGVVVGNLAITRLLRPSRRLRVMGPLCLFGTVPLVLAATAPSLPSSLAIFTLVGLGSAGLLPARAAVMTAVPDEFRGRVFGVAATGVNVAQLVAVLGAGAAAQALAPSTVIAVTGVVGFVAIVALMVTPGSGLPRTERRGRPRREDEDAAPPTVPRPLNL